MERRAAVGGTGLASACALACSKAARAWRMEVPTVFHFERSLPLASYPLTRI
jgi:hypothetical protein